MFTNIAFGLVSGFVGWMPTEFLAKPFRKELRRQCTKTLPGSCMHCHRSQWLSTSAARADLGTSQHEYALKPKRRRYARRV
jgi:hypothetical protein